LAKKKEQRQIQKKRESRSEKGKGGGEALHTPIIVARSTKASHFQPQGGSGGVNGEGKWGGQSRPLLQNHVDK